MDIHIQTTIIIIAGGVLGGLFGVITERSRFCTMGAITDMMVLGDNTRLKMWLWAIIVALVGMSAMRLLIDYPVAQTRFTQSTFNWLSFIVGGILFGIGMTLSSGCPAKCLIRAGAGSLKALMVLIIIAISGYATLKGLLSTPRLWLSKTSISLPSAQDLPSIFANQFNISPQATLIVITLIVVVTGSFYCLRTGSFRRSPLFSASAIGVLVVLGFWITGDWGFIAEHPDTLEEVFIGTRNHRPDSFSFVGPLAYSLELFILWSDSSRHFTFGIASAIGIMVGAGVSAWRGGRFRFEGFQKLPDMSNHLIGGVLMGFGGVCALGCSIGQGISGISTLALGSIIATLSIIFGCYATLKKL